MTISEQLYTQLNGAGLGVGVYPLAGPQPPPDSFVTYQRIASGVENVLAGNGSPPINNTRFQIDCYAKTYLAAAALSDAVTAAMQAWAVRNVAANSAEDFFEDAIKSYRVVTDFSVWHY